MAITMSEAMHALEKGRQHWRDCAAGKIEPITPKEFVAEPQYGWFAKGAVMEMNSINTKQET